MSNALTPAARQLLKGRAHRLEPVVMVGTDGLTPAVLAEVERALAAHELIKIRVLNADGDTRERFLVEICAATGAAPVQHIGKILIVYRSRPAEVPAAPAARPAPRRPPRPAGRGTPRRAKLRSR